jgi:hypothetical protein
MPDIVITGAELKSEHIDEVINLERSLTRSDARFVEDVPTPFYMNPIFYYAVASLVAACLVWLAFEPFYDDHNPKLRIPFIGDYLLFGPVAAGLGLAAGAVYGIVNRNLKQTFTCGIIGLGVGFGVTVVTTFIADMLFGLTTNLAVRLQGGVERIQPGEFPLSGIAFFVLVCGRGMAWCIVSMGAGLGLGVALKSKKLILNGLAGGMVGGMLGGLLFDPVSRFLTSTTQDGALSRGIGIMSVGVLVGLFVGLFETISKDAWFVMLQGPLAGKQFVIFKSPMVLGSAPKCDIYLFKDPAIDPKHATVAKSGSRYLLSDGGSANGTSVNGRSVDKHVLQPGDVIALGDTVLKYQERSRG